MDPQEGTAKYTRTISLDLLVNEQDMSTDPQVDVLDQHEASDLHEVTEADTMDEAKREAATAGSIAMAKDTPPEA